MVSMVGCVIVLNEELSQTSRFATKTDDSNHVSFAIDERKHRNIWFKGLFADCIAHVCTVMYIIELM